MGLKNGDIVLLHSSLASLGQVEGGARTVVDAFLDVLGENGTLVVPTFGALGVITEIVKTDPKAVCSIHPKASVAAIGKKAADICRDHWKAETAHADHTPYLRIAQLGGYVCLLGVDQDRNTTLHSAEALLRLPYLSTRKATFSTPDGEVTKEWAFFPGPHRDFIGLDRIFRESLPASGGAAGDQGGKIKFTRIGNSVVRLIKSQDLIDTALEAGRKNPAFVLCQNPHCEDCVAQRAALIRHRLSGESFCLAAAGSLAGRYIPEMIENLKASGLKLIELDYLEGRPIHLLPPEKIKNAAQELQAGECEITALRACAVTVANSNLLETARVCNISRVTLPLGSDSALLAEEAHKQGLTVSFYNLGMDSRKASDLILDLQNRQLKFGFTFNAAAFVAAGEKPFLFSYKQKLRRFIDQLDMEDALFDGSPAALAEGNAEIKEMISILRCASFPGLMVLGTRNRFAGTLRDAMGRFTGLLDNM